MEPSGLPSEPPLTSDDGVDSARFRTGLGHFATGVTVVTGHGADGRLVGKAAVGAYFADALGSYPDLHFDPPVHVAVGSGSVCFVYTSIKGLTAVETLVFAPGTRTVARAHCHYRAPAG